MKSRLYPDWIVERYDQMLVYADLSSRMFMNLLFLGSLLLSVISGVYLFLRFNWIVGIIGVVAVFFMTHYIVYLILTLIAEDRARKVEEILPDVLQLMSSNLRAGLTIDKALLSSSRPEFGTLNKEIGYIGKQIVLGKDLSFALNAVSKHVMSRKLVRAFGLIISGLNSGGSLAQLLDKTASDLNDQRIVEKEIKTSVKMYAGFVVFAVTIGAPLLFSLATILVEVITRSMEGVRLPEQAFKSLPFVSFEQYLSLDYIVWFLVVCLATVAFLGSLVMGLIEKGKEKEGIRYIPIFVTIALVMFYFVRFVLLKFFSGLFGV